MAPEHFVCWLHAEEIYPWIDWFHLCMRKLGDLGLLPDGRLTIKALECVGDFVAPGLVARQRWFVRIIQNGLLCNVKPYFDIGMDPNADTGFGHLLGRASGARNLPIVNFLLEQGASPLSGGRGARLFAFERLFEIALIMREKFPAYVLLEICKHLPLWRLVLPADEKQLVACFQNAKRRERSEKRARVK